MLDSLLYEPKRRRIAMATLAVVLVLAVGFLAFGALLESAAVLQVFGVAFLAASIFLIGKLLVVSHVHIRGTAGRLEALNNRFDETSRWLERFDADTRESLIVAKRQFEAASKARDELASSLGTLRNETLRSDAFDAFKAEATARNDALEAQAKAADARSDALQTAVDALETSIGESLESALVDAAAASNERFQKINDRVQKSTQGLKDELGTVRDEVREELRGLTVLAERIDSLEGELVRFDEVKAELERIEGAASEQAESARGSAVEELAKARAELEDQLRLVNGRVTKVDGEQDRKRQSALQVTRDDSTKLVGRLQKRVTESAQLGGRLRGDGYVQFPRVLSSEAIEAASAFSSKITDRQLKYLERKLQVIEGLCEGRLAGSVDDAIGRVLAGHMVRGKEIRILEIGVLFGIGAAFMHHALAPRHHRVRLALLDPFEGYYGKDHLDPLTGLPVTRAAVERNLARCGIPADDVEFLEGFSHEDAIRDAAEAAGPYHIIVIDGDHTAEGVRTDYEGYADMLRAGGLLVIDDYGSEDWPAVTEFVDETVRSDPRFKPVAVLGKTAVFKRARSTGGKKAAKQAEPRTSTKASSAKPAAEKAPPPTERPATDPAANKTDATAGDGDPPVPVVKSPRRSTKKNAKKATKRAAEPARSGTSDNAES